MSVSVCLNEENSMILIESIGQVGRREAGSAVERICELLRSHAVSGILIDANRVEQQTSPTLSSEMIAGFLLAVESTVPIAYVRPSGWDAAYYSTVMGAISDLLPPHVALFDAIEPANDWLRAAGADGSVIA
ncbi:MAG: hypothetical protein ACI82N_001607 [Maricaulis sp.]|jgi:hypothetical protein